MKQFIPIRFEHSTMQPVKWDIDISTKDGVGRNFGGTTPIPPVYDIFLRRGVNLILTAGSPPTAALHR